jgi:hypothetical protein
VVSIEVEGESVEIVDGDEGLDQLTTETYESENTSIKIMLIKNQLKKHKQHQ